MTKGFPNCLLKPPSKEGTNIAKATFIFSGGAVAEIQAVPKGMIAANPAKKRQISRPSTVVISAERVKNTTSRTRRIMYT